MKINLTGRILSDNEAETLKCGLEHEIATRPNEKELVVIVENIWDQIEHNGLCENLMKKKRLKTAISSVNYVLLCHTTIVSHASCVDCHVSALINSKFHIIFNQRQNTSNPST